MSFTASTKLSLCVQLLFSNTRLRGYQNFFMLNSAEHQIFSANKYENANNFHIY